LDHALAGTCVFAKQSLDAILCGRSPLPLYEVTYCRHPLSRSYGVILPSSFSVNHSSTLGFSPRLPVSDCGTVNVRPLLRSFSRQCARYPLAGSEDLASSSALGYPSGFAYPGTPTTFHENPPPHGLLAPASLLRIERPHVGTGILTCFPSATPFGLTLGTD
jgi:hypothetical protein